MNKLTEIELRIRIAQLETENWRLRTLILQAIDADVGCHQMGKDWHDEAELATQLTNNKDDQ